MKQTEFDSRFWDIITNEAARDDDLRRAVRWMILESDAVMAPLYSEGEPDYAEVMAQIRERYGLPPEGVNQAFTICEEVVEKELKLPKPEGDR